MAEAPSRLWAGSVLGRRSSRNATAVLNDVILRGRVVGFPLIATDGFEYDVGVSERLFGSACVYGPRCTPNPTRRRVNWSMTTSTQSLWSTMDSQRKRSTLHRLSVVCPTNDNHEGPVPPGAGR